jgi:hypothetical protein
MNASTSGKLYLAYTPPFFCIKSLLLILPVRICEPWRNGDMEQAEHVGHAGDEFAAALIHATDGVRALRRWTGDRTFEHPIGLAGSLLYLATKRVGAGSAHLLCVDRPGAEWESLNDARNAAENRVHMLSCILEAARELGENWLDHEKKWSDIREPLRTAEPWIFEVAK